MAEARREVDSDEATAAANAAIRRVFRIDATYEVLRNDLPRFWQYVEDYADGSEPDFLPAIEEAPE